MPEPTPTLEQINTLRDLFLKKIEKEPPSCGQFHPADIERAKTSNRWIQLFLEQMDLDMKQALNMLWETCTWRKTFGTNDITENTIRMDYMEAGAMFAKKQDVDGKYLIIVRTKLHQKGTKDMNELIRILVYWIERVQKETNYDQLTLFFDMQSAGLSNMDMDFTKRTIDTFKYYYPNSLNYIVIYEMAWILNAAFKIIKGLLPPKAVAKMKFLNAKTIKEYIPDEYCLKIWGGSDDYEFKFTPAKSTSRPIDNGQAEDTSFEANQSDTSHKRVHFANNNSQEINNNSPTPSNIQSMNENDMLQLNPSDEITFKKDGDKYYGKINVTNSSTNVVTFKVKTTSPQKFRVRPSAGVLTPSKSMTILVEFNSGSDTALTSKDKFLVKGIILPNDIEQNFNSITEFWKNTPDTNPNIENHRLKCTLYSERTDDGFKNVESNDSTSNNPRKPANDSVDGTGTQPNDIIQKLQQQLKYTQIFQIISIGIYILLSFIIIYIMKREINDQSTEFFDKECLNPETAAHPEL